VILITNHKYLKPLNTKVRMTITNLRQHSRLFGSNKSSPDSVLGMTFEENSAFNNANFERELAKYSDSILQSLFHKGLKKVIVHNNCGGWLSFIAGKQAVCEKCGQGFSWFSGLINCHSEWHPKAEVDRFNGGE
jgi:hypothetical protein